MSLGMSRGSEERRHEPLCELMAVYWGGCDWNIVMPEAPAVVIMGSISQKVTIHNAFPDRGFKP